ncbi:MAG TPA: acetyl-CoA C-acyltransferase [Candidatus Polarisedimenticolia bacterium]|nr:acetyl-CoA C-acyltransferase [Candidatus Polarisedimenticolia bacterium]
MADDIVILSGARTPMGEFNGPLRHLTEVELGALAARAAMERSGVKPSDIQHVVFGNAQQNSANAVYGARHVGLKAGVPPEVPALTVNRLCGSGIQSIVSAAHLMLLGEADVALAGGMESMSQAPHIIRGLRTGLRLGEGTLEDSLTTALMDNHCGLMMAQTADLLARETGITRQAADEFALRSQKLAAAAAETLREEIVPVEVRRKGKSETVAADDHPRPDTTMEGLARLPPVFGTQMVTAGNASGIVDGGAAVVMATSGRARSGGVRPLGRLAAWHYEGVEPRLMGRGPVPAIRGALRKAGLSLKEIDLFEINEAFAVQYLAVEKELGLDRERVNVNGGAVALGHPLGATGTRLALTLLLELRRRHARYGVASACIGGGQGIALLVESAG